MDATGVLGCLTADQEARLQQLWMFLLNAFEIQEFSDSNVAMSGMSRRSSSINDGAPLSPSSINTTPPSSSRRSMSLSSNHNFYNFSNPFANTVPNTPLTPAFPPTSPTSNSENDNPKPKYQRSLRRLRRRTSLASNGETKPSNEKFPTEPSTPSILRRASTRAGSLAFQTQSMGGINLRPSPQNAKVMQRVLASHKITPDELRMGLLASLKQDHPDAMLLRFLRARKWDVGKAFVMLVAAVAWRTKTMHVDDDILPRGEIHAVQKIRDGNIKEQKDSWDFLNQFRMGKNIIHGVDRAGRPIIDIRVRLHRAEDQSVEMLERYIVHTIESVKMLLRPPLVETAILIFDMTDFSMANMDYTPVKYIIKCMENFYPESLAAIILHKAPWFFSGIWKMIKTWMNDSLVSKVHFTKTLEDLELFIPRSNIPPDLGGTDDKYEYHYIEPDVHDRAENLSLDVHSPTREFLSNQRQQIAEDLLDATRLWLQTSAMRDGIGSAVQQDRRATLIEELRLNFWKLDPFLRARCQLDREGVIVSDGIGTIDFYPHVSAAARRGTDVSMEEGQAVTATSPLPKTSPRNSQGKAGLGLISPSSSTLGEHAEKVEQVERVADLKAEPRTPSSLNFLDDARICMDDEHDYHDESSPTRDEIMQEYMDDDEEEDHPLQHPHTVDYKEKPEYHPHAVQPIAADMHLSAAQKESDMHSVVSFDIDDLDEEDDEEIEIHDAITQRIPYPRGGGIVERAAIRVINVR